MDRLHESKRASRITKERFKTVVHVLLDVAVKESEARLIGSEIYDRSTVIGDHDCIFDNAGGFFAVGLNQLPDVAVKVHGMSIIGAVAHHQTVARPLLEYKLAVMRVRLTIDEPYCKLYLRAPPGIFSKISSMVCWRAGELEMSFPKMV